MSDPQDWRSRKRDATRQRVYDAAMQLFRERGFDAVSVGDIASAAGVSVPTFYAHFPSREHVVMPMPTQEEVAAVIGAQPADLSVADQMRGAIMDWFAHFGQEERADLLERWRIIIASPSLRNRTGEFERATATLVLNALPGEAEHEPSALVPGVVVSAMFSAYTQVLLRWAEEDGHRTLEEVAEEVLDALRQI